MGRGDRDLILIFLDSPMAEFFTSVFFFLISLILAKNAQVHILFSSAKTLFLVKLFSNIKPYVGEYGHKNSKNESLYGC